MPEKESFDDVLKYLRKKGHFVFKEELISRICTGIVGLDFLSGGGIPLGRVVEIFGLDGSGKTTIAAEITKAFQDKNKKVIYLDYEHSVDLGYFKNIGVKLDQLLFDQPFCLETGMDAAIKLIDAKGVGLLVVDSVAAMVPKDELEGEVIDNTIGLQARKIGQAFRKLVGVLNRRNTTALFINQLRSRIGQWDAKFHPFDTTGGKALKYYASIRLETKRISEEKEIGKTRHRLILKKQKTFPMLSGVVEYFIGSSGIDRIEHLRTSLLNIGIITKNNRGTYKLDDTEIASSDEEMDFLLKEEKRKKIYEKKLIEAWKKNIYL